MNLRNFFLEKESLSRIFGPIKAKGSVPNETVSTLYDLSSLLFCKL